MAIKETPTNYRVYYKYFINDKTEKLKEAITRREELEKEIDDKYNAIKPWLDVYKTQFDIDLDKYEEFQENKYITGKFYRLAKGLFINRNNDYELVTDLFNLYELADRQKQLYDCNKNIKFLTACTNLSIKEYTDILRAYYTEVHKKLILDGNGYSFGNGIGWICVVRCTFDRKSKILDYVATKKREQELLAKGERIYNKEEAEWCVRNGIEYNAKDKRVFVCNEYCYQIPIINCTLTNGSKYKLQISDYRHAKLRGKTNDDLIALCNGDTTKICELPVDLKTKVTLCDKADKILYTKFIRNENQKPFTFRKTNR